MLNIHVFEVHLMRAGRAVRIHVYDVGVQTGRRRGQANARTPHSNVENYGIFFHAFLLWLL